MEDKIIKTSLSKAKTIAMVGVSSIKIEDSSNVKRRPSIIVMKYLQEFGYRVIPVNPFSAGKEIYGETVVAKLQDIKIPIDIVDVFRPSNEAPTFAKETVQVGGAGAIALVCPRRMGGVQLLAPLADPEE